MPPAERRTLHVFYQRPTRRFRARPTGARRCRADPRRTTSPSRRRPGAELILLRRDRLTLLSLAARTPRIRDLDGPRARSRWRDERGIDRIALAREGLAAEPACSSRPRHDDRARALGRDCSAGSTSARAPTTTCRAGRTARLRERAQIYFDHPRLSVATSTATAAAT
jgi:hypothetical protein